MKLQKQNPIWYFTGNEYFCGMTFTKSYLLLSLSPDTDLG